MRRSDTTLAIEDEAAAALIALGYTPTEAASAPRGVAPASKATPEERVRAALRKAVTNSGGCSRPDGDECARAVANVRHAGREVSVSHVDGLNREATSKRGTDS